MSTLAEEEARTAALEHGLTLARFAVGEEPPPIVDEEERAKLIYAGIVHMDGILRAQRALIAEYQRWAEEVRPRVVLLHAMLHLSPAHEAWRKAAIADRRRPVLERLAAWEATAVLCEAEGNTELASSARATARRIAPRAMPAQSTEQRVAV